MMEEMQQPNRSIGLTFWKYCLIFWKFWFCFFAFMLLCSIMNWLENDGKHSFSDGGSSIFVTFMSVISGIYLLVKKSWNEMESEELNGK